MGKYDDLFDAAPSPTPSAEVGKYSDLFDEPGVVAEQQQPEGGDGFLAKVNAALRKPSPAWLQAPEAATRELVTGMMPHDVPSYLASLSLPLSMAKQGADVGAGLARGDVSGVPLVGRIPEIAAADETPAFSKERYLTAMKTLMDVGMLAGGGERAPLPLRGEPLATPELPSSPSMGPGTIAGDVSRALERRFTLQEPPPEPPLAPPPPIEDTLSNIPKEPPVFNPELGPQTIPETTMPLRTEPAVDVVALRKRKAQIETSIAPSKAIGQRTAYDEELAGIKQKLGEPVAVSATAVGTGKPYRSAALRYFGTEVVEAPSHAQALAASPYASEAGFESGFVTHEGQFVPYTGEIGAVPPEGPVNAQEAPRNEVPASGGVPVAAPGTVRLYHGSSEGATQAGRDFTTDRQYASDYAAKAQGGGEGKVWYVDVPEGVVKTHDEYGQPMTRVVVPDEIANQARPLTPPIADIPAEDVKYAGGEPVPQAFSEEPHVSAIANRFTAERAAAGELGEIKPGESVNTMDLVHHGLKMSPEQVNASVSRVMQGGDVPINDVAALRGEEARLSQRSGDLSRAARANPSPEAQLAADNAFKDLTDFHNGPVAQAKRNWHHQGKLMQGEIPVDLSTLNGMREAWLKDTGKPPPAHVEPKLQQVADKLAKAIDEERAAARNGGEAIDKATRGRKMPTPEEVRNNIAERMGVEPCIV